MITGKNRLIGISIVRNESKNYLEAENTEEKPTIKNIYKKIIKPILNVITFRVIRKQIFSYFMYYKNKKYIKSLEKSFPKNSVLIFQHQFFDREGKQCFNGGAERYIRDLSSILKELNYYPILIQMGNKKTKEKWVKPIDDFVVYGLPAKNIEDYSQKISFFKNYSFVIYSGATLWSKKSLLHPNIMISHGVTWDSPNTKKINNVVNYFTDVDNLVSVDTNTISWLRTTFFSDFHNKKMFYVPNYVDTTIYKKIEKKNNTDRIKIIFPRRASSERGYWLISRVLPIILTKYPNVDFEFIGFIHTNEIKNNIEYLINSFPNRIKHSLVEPSKMVNFYQSVDISLIPTLYSEGTSLSCLEAQACGNVVIATNIGGLPNLIIDGYNGILINPNEKELIEALDRVINNEDLRNTLSENAIKVSKVFDKSVWVERWKEIIKDNM